MKRFLLTLAILAAALAARADDGWHVYAAYHDATQTAALGGRIYVLSSGNLYSYDPEDTSVETYDKASALSDNAIYRIAPCAETGELAVVYANGNIDLLQPGGDVFNMPELKMKSLSDKTLNDAQVDGHTLYVSTNSGIVCVNLKSRTFGDFYYFGQPVSSVVSDGTTFFAATPSGVYAAALADNMLDPAAWQWIGKNVYRRLCRFEGNIYALQQQSLNAITRTDNFTGTILARAKFADWSIANSQLWAFAPDIVATVAPDGTAATRDNTDPAAEQCAYLSGTYWTACGASGLQGLDAQGALKTASIIPNSPVRDYCYQLRMVNDNTRLLVAGGAFNYPEVKREGTIMRYEGGTWYAFDEEGPQSVLVKPSEYINVTDIVQDPADTEHHYASTARNGLYEFRDYKLANHFTYDNSPLRSILPGDPYEYAYVRLTGLAFDNDRNLWMLNNNLDTIVRILHPNGTWSSLYFDEIAGYPTLDHVVFDQRGWAWINSRRATTAHRAGVLVYDPKTRKHRFISTIVNQDGTEYTPTIFSCMTEDLDGAMWVGNDRGIFVTYSPATIFDDDFYFTQVKVPRNDGTNLADYLLSDVDVKCIAIDGGNRKWVGTNGSGVFLISADGLETLHNFTAENSPLLDNEVYDIAIDGRTGEVFFATGAGLVSYLGNATDPAASLEKDNVKVYPNPVRPDYQGDINITGLMYNSDVKIVSAAGKLVHHGTSVGGTYTWNRRLASGGRAASGIYFVLATDSEGNDGVVAKFLIVND